MNENLVTYTFSVGNPTEAVALGDNALYFMVPFGATLVYVSAAPYEDDASATLDINDDGSTIITALTCADKDVPGEWISTHCGGTETPVEIAAGSVCDFDFNSAAAGNRFAIVMLMLQGETWG
jgi:hypothetical protein